MWQPCPKAATAATTYVAVGRSKQVAYGESLGRKMQRGKAEEGKKDDLGNDDNRLRRQQTMRRCSRPSSRSRQRKVELKAGATANYFTLEIRLPFRPPLKASPPLNDTHGAL
jgi:hypothetical protein